MRSNAEISQAILTAISQGPCTLRDAAERAQVGYKAARATIGNLTRSKRLRICGQEKRAHAKGWCRLYEVVEQVAPEDMPTPEARGAQVLADTLASWGR